jgi:hypothetical protein
MRLVSFETVSGTIMINPDHIVGVWLSGGKVVVNLVGGTQFVAKEGDVKQVAKNLTSPG